ncbi:MAG: polymer-forming cytoskeletal protein [Bacteroidetes bacterium]|nr:polymer-forming cytoskeletal protein [Bacteroidota bacterium]
MTMAKNNEVESPSINLIGPGTIINGDINCNGDIRIDGSLIGSINSKGKIVVGTTGLIEGEIICQNADFSGVINANVMVGELISLKATAKLTGDLVTNKLAIEPGAKYTGKCNMSSNPIKENKFSEINEKPKSQELS